jgi:hypothetical protein
MEEGWEMQVQAAIWKLEQYGPDYIENWVAEISGKLTFHLPSHYWEAKRRWYVKISQET